MRQTPSVSQLVSFPSLNVCASRPGNQRTTAFHLNSNHITEEQTSTEIKRLDTAITSDPTFSAQVRPQLRQSGTHAQRPHDRPQLSLVRNLSRGTGVEVETVAELVHFLLGQVTSHLSLGCGELFVWQTATGMSAVCEPGFVSDASNGWQEVSL